MTLPLLQFNTAEVSHAFQTLPNQYGMIGQMGLFGLKGVPTTYVVIEEQNGILTLLPSNASQAPASIATKGKRKKYVLQIPKIEHNDSVSPEDIQNLQAFGGATPANMATFLNDRLSEMKSKHDLTIEWLMRGALNGSIVDGDGSTVLHDLFTIFGMSETTVDFALGTTTTKVLGKCHEVIRHIRKEIKGDTISGYTALVSPGFYSKLISHPLVEKFYLNWQGSVALGQNALQPFTFGGITFIEYDATVTDAAGASQEFYGTDLGRCFPTGTRNTFKMFAAPADFNESVNVMGNLYYAKTKERDFGRGFDIHTQSNPLPICVKPQVLVKIHSSN